jgi:hypothetical protein
MHPGPDDMEFTTIQVTKVTRERLKKLGKKGETYDEIVTRLLMDYEEIIEP